MGYTFREKEWFLSFDVVETAFGGAFDFEETLIGVRLAAVRTGVHFLKKSPLVDCRVCNKEKDNTFIKSSRNLIASLEVIF